VPLIVSELQNIIIETPKMFTSKELGDIFRVDWEVLFHTHDWSIPFSGRIQQSKEELIEIVESSCRKFKKCKFPGVDFWRTEVCHNLMENTVGQSRFSNPTSLPMEGNFTLYDRNGKVLVKVVRKSYPDILHSHMNDILTNIYGQEFNLNIQRNESNREVGFSLPSKHYCPHLYNERGPNEKKKKADAY